MNKESAKDKSISAAKNWRILIIFIKYCFALVALSNGISTFMGYLMPNPSFSKNISFNLYLGDKGVHNFLKGISSKVNVVKQLMLILV